MAKLLMAKMYVSFNFIKEPQRSEVIYMFLLEPTKIRIIYADGVPMQMVRGWQMVYRVAENGTLLHSAQGGGIFNYYS